MIVMKKEAGVMKKTKIIDNINVTTGIKVHTLGITAIGVEVLVETDLEIHNTMIEDQEKLLAHIEIILEIIGIDRTLEKEITEKMITIFQNTDTVGTIAVIEHQNGIGMTIIEKKR